MKNKIAITFLIITCGIFSLFLTGCKDNYKGYKGEHVDLYSVAINSILGSKGVIYSEVRHSPVVELIEEDIYGRKLFCYSELDKVFGEVSLIICQKSDDQYAYFYENNNFISAPLAFGNNVHIYGSIRESTIDNPLNDFTEDEINQLKQINDWGEILDTNKFTKVDIVCEKIEPQINKDSLQEIYKFALGDKGYSSYKSYLDYFTSDLYGRSIFVAHGLYSENKHVIVLINSDGTYDIETCILELENYQDYRSELIQFKRINNWNTPFS